MLQNKLKTVLNNKKIIITGAVALVLILAVVLTAVLLHHKQYEVKFYSDTQTVLKVDRVKRNASAIPPKEPDLSYGLIFKSWDKGFTHVKKNLEINPVFEQTKGKNNVFALSGTYGKQGETVFVPLVLTGKVLVSGFDMEITYDKKALKFDSYFYEDAAAVINADTPGKIKINFVSTNNAQADVDICSLKFEILAKNGEYPLQTKIKSIYAFEDDKNLKNDKLTTPEFSTIDGTVFVID